jgi:hypothetical protein
LNYQQQSYSIIIVAFLFLFCVNDTAYAQSKTPFFQKSDTLNKKRRTSVYLSEAIIGTAAIVGLNELWYSDYPRSNFHSINDNLKWMQMDKLGHTFSAYFIGKLSMDALAWAGESKKNQLLYGATLGFVFLTTVEVLDGFSQEWGFSTGDIMANALGTGLLIGQELLWDEQRIQLKFSFSPTNYPDLIPDKLGNTTLEQLLKDYNGQTYWLSFNLRSFFTESKIPKWFNVAVGYGANGLPEGSYDFSTRPPQPIDSYRQFFASIDVDLTKIKTNSGFLKTVFNVFNYVKIPAPSLEYRSNGEFVFHFLYF